MENFKKSIKYVEINNNGEINKVLGIIKASDLHPQPYFVSGNQYDKSRMNKFYDSDVFLELGIRRMQL